MTVAEQIRAGALDHDIVEIERAIADRVSVLYGMRTTSYRPCATAGCTIPAAPHDDHYHCPKCHRVIGSMGHRCPYRS